MQLLLAIVFAFSACCEFSWVSDLKIMRVQWRQRRGIVGSSSTWSEPKWSRRCDVQKSFPCKSFVARISPYVIISWMTSSQWVNEIYTRRRRGDLNQRATREKELAPNKNREATATKQRKQPKHHKHLCPFVCTNLGPTPIMPCCAPIRTKKYLRLT